MCPECNLHIWASRLLPLRLHEQGMTTRMKNTAAASLCPARPRHRRRSLRGSCIFGGGGGRPAGRRRGRRSVREASTRVKAGVRRWRGGGSCGRRRRRCGGRPGHRRGWRASASVRKARTRRMRKGGVVGDEAGPSVRGRAGLPSGRGANEANSPQRLWIPHAAWRRRVPYSASLGQRQGLVARAWLVASPDDDASLSPHSINDGGVFLAKMTRKKEPYRRAVHAISFQTFTRRQRSFVVMRLSRVIMAIWTLISNDRLSRVIMAIWTLVSNDFICIYYVWFSNRYVFIIKSCKICDGGISNVKY